ncbi:MAG: hypothetical protein NTU97_00915 [Candidatus Magasanikbacteria bacterium]|nr:hypothetical protein [Candidatus Magasanikbacteria bacterium]
MNNGEESITSPSTTVTEATNDVVVVPSAPNIPPCGEEDVCAKQCCYMDKYEDKYREAPACSCDSSCLSTCFRSSANPKYFSNYTESKEHRYFYPILQ